MTVNTQKENELEPIDKLERIEWDQKGSPEGYVYNLILLQQEKINQLVDAVNQLRLMVEPAGEGYFKN